MKRPTLPFVLVRWDDANASSTEMVTLPNLTKVHKPVTIMTAGWVLRDDEAGITIAYEYCGDDEYRGLTFVPRSLVKDVSPLVKPRAKRTTLKAHHAES